MTSLVSLCVAFTLTAPVVICAPSRQASEWTVQTVRRHVNISNSLANMHSRSLLGCVSFCSNLMDTFVPYLYFTQETGNCTCKTVSDETSEDENKPEVVFGTRTWLQQIEITNDVNVHTKTTVWPYKHDCFDLFEDLYHDDHVYVIQPPGGSVTDTWCDMTNGGWTVIERRMDGSEDFNRGWSDYVTGFGNRNGEYWLGLDNIHFLTKDGSELVVYMETFPGVTPSSMTAHYSNFKIGNAVSKFTIDISGFNGTCGDAMAYHNGRSFTTMDNDNDGYGGNCAVKFKGAWWHHVCHRASLNGQYFMDGDYDHLDQELWATGIHWYQCWDRQQSSKFAEMKIRRNP